MKKLLIPLILVSISTLSCEKDNLIPKKDIPDWLKENIKVTRTVNFIGLSRFLQTVSGYQDNTGNVEIGNCPLRSTRNQ
jgi:hypothetical protein